jgi:hypothetical protein
VEKKRYDEKEGFIKNVFCMQEKRVSTLILCLVSIMALAFYLYLVRGDIPETLLSIIQTLIYIVGGVNGLNVATKVFTNSVEKKRGHDYDG